MARSSRLSVCLAITMRNSSKIHCIPLAGRFELRKLGITVIAFVECANPIAHQYGRTNPISTFRSKTYAFAYPCGSEVP